MKRKTKIIITLYSLLSVCISLAAAGLYGWKFKSDVFYDLPGEPDFIDYVIEGLHVYLIMELVFLSGSTLFLFLHEKKRISFCLCFVLLNIILAIIGLLACIPGW
ncbi:MAG: hypothetical protein J1F02_05725 [Lachnospiraceae bacterium]|nr:hypothetical protein [Lachnospiraceae bacterium]